MKRLLSLTAVIILAAAGLVSAQGVQTATLTGQVTTPDGAPLPGVAVTAQSSTLQGVRTVITDENGGYIFKALPPGAYTVKFELTGMTTVEQKRSLGLGATIDVDVVMQIGAIQETLTITAETPSVVSQITRGENYTNQQIDNLPTARTMQGIAELAPGLTDNTPNAGQVTISGGFAFDNVFLLNGVDVNDNLFGNPNNLFIEDAIEEVQVLTSGISAEYGRFGGGVINAITKKGGNEFHGSGRLDLTNPGWRDETPIDLCDAPGQNPATCTVVDRSKNAVTGENANTVKTWIATLGGPIMKDRLWFFGAFRTQPFEDARQLYVSQIPYTFTQDETRWQGSLTGSINPNHTVSASYTNTLTEQTGPSLSGYAADVHTFYQPQRRLPQNLFVANYSGVLSSRLFAEAQYSQKKFRFENTGGMSTDFIDSPIFTYAYGPAHYYNAPYFAGTDPEDRDNRQITGSLSYFLSTESIGRHDIKVGYEHYTSTRTGGNSQSATGYVLYNDYLGSSGHPVLDANGYFQPVFIPGESYAVRWIASFGAEMDTTTQSFYLNDKWQFGNFTANLGARYEKVRSESTGGIVGADTDTLVPRLGVSWDVKGDGRFTLDATYAQYAGKASETQFGNNSTVGNPAYLYVLYTGPEGVGRSCTECFDPANYTEIFGGSFPTATISFADGLSAQKNREFSFGAGTTFARNGYLKATFTDRKVLRFFEGRTDTTTGTTLVNFEGVEIGEFNNTVNYNPTSDDGLMREYRALQLQAGIRPYPRWNVQGHWTHQFRNHGNYEGEGTNTPGSTSLFGDFPEIYVADRHFPIGRLNDYQSDKIRLWTNYDLGLGAAGSLNVGVLYRYDTGLTQSLTALRVPWTAQQRAAFALYAQSPGSSQTLFFGERGEVEFDPSHVVDLSLNYELPLFSKKVRPWVKLDVRNILNNQKLTGYGTNVVVDRTSPTDAMGLPTGYTNSSTYGFPRNNADYVVPREFFVSLGFRF